MIFPSPFEGRGTQSRDLSSVSSMDINPHPPSINLVAPFKHNSHRFSINAMFLAQDALRKRFRRVAILDPSTTACSTIAPASRFSSTKCTVHPANFTPCSIA